MPIIDQYAVYLRKSRKDEEAVQGESIEKTLERHKKTLFDLANRQNLHIGKVFPEVVSGDSIDSRPVMIELLKEVEQGVWAGVLVMEVERLARGDTEDQGRVAKAFKYTETLIVTPQKTYDPSNEFDEGYFEFGLFMSRQEYKAIKRRMQRGRAESVREGKYVGNSPPYGYKRVKLEKEKGWTLAPVNDEAEIVRQIFEWYTAGEIREDGTRERIGVQLIARKLNKMGIKPKKGTAWVSGSVRDILINRHYAGFVRWNWRPAKRKLVDGVVEVSRPRNAEPIIAIGRHKAIIDKITFDLAQEYMAKNPVKPRKEGQKVMNPWAGLIKCGVCGRTMTRRPYKDNKQPDTLLCQFINCNNVSSELHVVEKRILEGLGEWLKGYRLQWETGEPENKKKTKSNAKQKALLKLTKELEALNAQRKKAHTLLERDIYDFDTFTTRMNEIAADIIQIEASKAALEKELALEEARETVRGSVIPKVERLLEVYNELPTPTAKNELLKEVLEKVMYTKEKRGGRYGGADTFEVVLYPKLPESV